MPLISTAHIIDHVSGVHIKKKEGRKDIPAQIWRIIERALVSAHSIAHTKLLVLIAWHLQHHGVSKGLLIKPAPGIRFARNRRKSHTKIEPNASWSPSSR